MRTEDLQRHDITTFQSEALLFFTAHNGARILDLKNHLDISHQAARNLVERVRQKGLVELQVNPDDARSKNVFLTEKGKILSSKLQSQGTIIGKEILSGISDEEKTKLLQYLEKIRENIS